MYIRLTPKQLTVLKKLLPTVKLNAYDIQIFQEIQNALDNPVEEQKKPTPHPIKKSEPTPQKKDPVTEPTFKSISSKKEKPSAKIKEQLSKAKEDNQVDEVQTESESENNETESGKLEYIESLKTDKKSELSETSEFEEELEDIEGDDEPQGIFTVIDKRTRKPL